MTPIPAKVLAVDNQGDQHNVIVRIGPQLGLEPSSAAKVIEAFYKYARDTDDTPRQTATRIGVPMKTLRTWLEGEAQPNKRLIIRLAGFLRRARYI